MAALEIPEDIRILLRDHLPSHEQLELLLLMHTDPMREWSVEDLAETLKISPMLAEEAINQLAADELIDLWELPSNALRCRGPRDACRDLVSRLAQIYQDNRVEVLMLMSANAIQRMRTGALRAFADAFVIKKKDTDG